MSNLITYPRTGLYLCSRTSAYGDKPCDEAFQIWVQVVDVRNCDDPKKIPVNKGTDGDWYIRGTNHRIENGKITRDLTPEQIWAVEVSDIVDFVDKHGTCVVSKKPNGFYSIEIYDTSRE